MNDEHPEAKPSPSPEGVNRISLQEYKELLTRPLPALVEQNDDADAVARRALEFIAKRGYQYQPLPDMEKPAHVTNPKQALLALPITNAELLNRVKGFFTPLLEGGATISWSTMRDIMKDVGAQIVERYVVTDIIIWMEDLLCNITRKAIDLAAGKEIDTKIMSQAISQFDFKHY